MRCSKCGSVKRCRIRSTACSKREQEDNDSLKQIQLRIAQDGASFSAVVNAALATAWRSGIAVIDMRVNATAWYWQPGAGPASFTPTNFALKSPRLM